MGLDIYVDDDFAAHFSTNSGWDEAATWIEKNTPANTPLRRLVELGETHRPQQAASMLADLLKQHEPSPDIADTLSLLHRFLRMGDHVLLWGGVISEP